MTKVSTPARSRILRKLCLLVVAWFCSMDMQSPEVMMMAEAVGLRGLKSILPSLY